MKIELMEKIMKNNDDMIIKAIQRTSAAHDCSILNVTRNENTIKVYIKFIECRYKHLIINEYKVDNYMGFNDIYFQTCINKCKLMEV